MPFEFDTFLIGVLVLFAVLGHTTHRRRRASYLARLGAPVTVLQGRTQRMMVLLVVLSLAALAGAGIGIARFATMSGIDGAVGLAACAAAGLFLWTAHRESHALFGANGFAIPYYDLYLPWSAIELIEMEESAGRDSGWLAVRYRSGSGSRTLRLRLSSDATTAALDVCVRRNAAAQGEPDRVDVAGGVPGAINS
jgi:hypothetical protein